MIFELQNQWKTNTEYIEALTKKYRDQYKRAHKKFEGIETLELSLDEIILKETEFMNCIFM